MNEFTEEIKEEAVDTQESTAAESTTGIQSAADAVEAMKASAVPTGGIELWKSVLDGLKDEMDKRLSKADETVTELVESEKKKAADAVAEEMQAKLDALEKEKDEQIEALTKENEELRQGFDAKKDELTEQIEKEFTQKQEAEVASVKAQYEQQIQSLNDANHDKLQAMRKEIDGYKEQIETLMLEIDDPFVLQQIQSGAATSADAAPEAAEAEASE
ncbi:MAG: hypothetical protein K6E84_06035 [Lachnospiraceae bacterium]|nr:hypothetical protein [Lachnospiraceae bacterium]